LSSTLLVLQHIACEPPAVFEDELRSRGLDLIRVGLDEGERLPDWRDFAATIVMGGPMGAYEEDLHPWLVEEKRHIRDVAQPVTRSGAFAWERSIQTRPFATSGAYALQVPSRGDSRAGGRMGRRAGLRPVPGEDSGPGALNRLVDEVNAHASSTIPLARGLFGRWLERVARVPAQAIG
jgi:hypothetical protein